MYQIFFTMNDYSSIRNQSCPNASCTFYKKLLAENVVVHSQNSQRMRCKACKKTWAAYRNEIRYGLRTDPQKLVLALELLKEGMSIRSVAQRIDVSPSSIQRWKRRAQSAQKNLSINS